MTISRSIIRRIEQLEERVLQSEEERKQEILDLIQRYATADEVRHLRSLLAAQEEGVLLAGTDHAWVHDLENTLRARAAAARQQADEERARLTVEAENWLQWFRAHLDQLPRLHPGSQILAIYPDNPREGCHYEFFLRWLQVPLRDVKLTRQAIDRLRPWRQKIDAALGRGPALA